MRDEAELHSVLLEGNFRRFVFTPGMVGIVCEACNPIGLPHLAGSADGSFIKVKAGKNDDPGVFLGACRKQMSGSGPKTSCGFSAGNARTRCGKAPFIIDLVKLFTSGNVPDVSQVTALAQHRLDCHRLPPDLTTSSCRVHRRCRTPRQRPCYTASEAWCGLLAAAYPPQLLRSQPRSSRFRSQHQPLTECRLLTLKACAHMCRATGWLAAC